MTELRDQEVEKAKAILKPILATGIELTIPQIAQIIKKSPSTVKNWKKEKLI